MVVGLEADDVVQHGQGDDDGQEREPDGDEFPDVVLVQRCENKVGPKSERRHVILCGHFIDSHFADSPLVNSHFENIHFDNNNFINMNCNSANRDFV